jgi:hypothetical protein
MAFLLGLAPNVANPKVLLGTSGALGLAFSGFANTDGHAPAIEGQFVLGG